MSERIGFSTGFLKTPISDGLIDLCRQAGVSRVELWDENPPLPDGPDLEKLARKLQAAGITVTSLHGPATLGPGAGGLDDFIERFTSCCRKAALLGASYVVVHPLLFGGESLAGDTAGDGGPADLSTLTMTWQVWDRLTGVANEHGLTAAFENLPSRPSQRAVGCHVTEVVHVAQRLRSAGRDAGVCFDTSHSFANGRSPLEELTAIPSDLLRAVHVSDGVEGNEADRHLPPGEGDLDWHRFFDILRERSFAGELILEVKTPYFGPALLGQMVRYLMDCGAHGLALEESGEVRHGKAR